MIEMCGLINQMAELKKYNEYITSKWSQFNFTLFKASKHNLRDFFNNARVDLH